MAEENQPYRDETDGGEEAPPQRSFLRKDEGGSRNYVVRNNKYVLTNEETVQKCHCCDKPCRYFNFYRCQTEPANCMQDMPSAISICTHQFSEFDNLNRTCDGEPTRWWFRVRFYDFLELVVIAVLQTLLCQKIQKIQKIQKKNRSCLAQRKLLEWLSKEFLNFTTIVHTNVSGRAEVSLEQGCRE